MKNVTAIDNILMIDGVEILFKYKITKFAEINNVVVVRLEMRSRDDDINNIYGVIDGKIAWRVQDMLEFNPDYAPFAPNPYTGIRIYDKNPELIIATSWGGFRFLINPNNGKIVGTESWVK
ncbi:MAG: hypothetical protein H6Q61_1156 [Firmicutes bacterium]|nr:hypothetical protein [Bacillota bacterium]